MLRTSLTRALCASALLLAAACKEEEMDVSGDETDTDAGTEGEDCAPGEEGACEDGLVCESVADGDGSVCAEPLEVRGMVIDALDESAIEGALVIGLDSTGAPVTDVAITDAAGHYVLQMPVLRDADGEPVEGAQFTLQASAEDYQAYPSGLRPAFPIAADDAIYEEQGETGDEDPHEVGVIENAATTIALLPVDGAQGRTIAGWIPGEIVAGTLVVAEGAVTPAPWAISDKSGSFTIFNAPTDEVTLVGYRTGVQLLPEAIDAGSEDVLDVELGVSEDELATVEGSVNIVNAPGGSETSVVLIPASTFDPVFEYGPVPYGLRAPDPGESPSVSGAFSIAEVPIGTYKVIAALENDLLVRDPDTGIAGTDIVEIEVPPAETVTLSESFKVTEALAVDSPGAEGPEEVSGTPVFLFEDDSSEDFYDLVVHDALGNEIWRDDAVPSVSGAELVSVDYGGPGLESGMYYRFRATSMRQPPNGDPTPISRTEDLRGVFVWRE